jgi:hypothetical protein
MALSWSDHGTAIRSQNQLAGEVFEKSKTVNLAKVALLEFRHLTVDLWFEYLSEKPPRRSPSPCGLFLKEWFDDRFLKMKS